MSLLPLLLTLSQLVTVGAPSVDDSPAAPGEWGFRPAAGSTSSITPPAFVWRPVPEAVAYTLEIARDEAFSEGVRRYERLPLSSFAPDTPLEAGAWYWRYAANDRDAAQGPWSEVRPFEVATNAKAFPKPPVADLLSRMPEGHPRLFFRPEEVPALKEVVAGPLKGSWEGLLAQADRLLKSPPDTTEPPKYPEGIELRGEQWKKIWWGNRKRAIDVTDGAATLAFAYQLTGEKKYGDGAKKLLLAFCEWDPRGATGYDYNDEAGMPLLYFPARAYSWAHDRFSDAERAKMIAVMTVRGNDCFNHLRKREHLWKPYASHSNRAWHFLGEVAIAFNGEIPEAPQWLDYAMTIFYTCYPVWGGDDGGWHEGTAYWSSYMSRFMYWALASQAAFNIDPFEKPFFASTGYYTMYSLPPGTKAGAFGDQAERTTAQSVAGLMRSFAAGAKNGHWMWHAIASGAKAPSGYLGIVERFRAGEVTPIDPAALPSSRAFPEAGLAVLNSDLTDGANNVQIHFKSSPMGRQSHGYNSNNAFLLHIEGERALRMTGKRDVYGSPHHKEWMWETKSDNAILVNGKGQVPHSPSATGRITHFQTSATLDVVAGEAGESYDNLDRWTRRIFFFKPFVVLIHDVLEAPEESTYQWLLHGENGFILDDDGALWEGENGSVDVAFIHPEKLDISQSKEFSTPPAEWANFKLNEAHLTAATTEKRKKQEFITLLTINDADVEYQHERKDDQSTLAIALPDRIVAVRLTPDKFEVREEE